VKVDLDWLDANLDQLFAEAVAAYLEGKPHWPDREFEKGVIAPKQAERQVFDNWTDRVLEAVGVVPVVSIAAIWTVIAGASDVARLDMLAQKRIASILKTNGFRKGQNTDGRIVWRKVE
jgi:predicted P-loop ATPase